MIRISKKIRLREVFRQSETHFSHAIFRQPGRVASEERRSGGGGCAQTAAMAKNLVQPLTSGEMDESLREPCEQIEQPAANGLQSRQVPANGGPVGKKMADREGFEPSLPF